jgi:hypothetical protein
LGTGCLGQEPKKVWHMACGIRPELIKLQTIFIHYRAIEATYIGILKDLSEESTVTIPTPRDIASGLCKFNN